MNTIKKIAIALAVLMVLSLAAPAAATYAGDKPLVTAPNANGPLKDGGIVYETVTDGTGYMILPCPVYVTDTPRDLTQTITIAACTPSVTSNCIPSGATVKMARLYNYVSWSTADNDTGTKPWNNTGLPAEADMRFNGVNVTCQNPLSPLGPQCTGLNPPVSCRDALPNPIDYGNGVIQYWDTKGQGYADPGMTKWDYPSGTFAWDVTNMVNGSGTFTAEIRNNDSSPTGMRPGKAYHATYYRERFVTYGFGLLVVYENLSSPAVTGKYWIDEGCDLLYNTSKYGVYEPPATTYAPFRGGVGWGNNPYMAGLTQVVVTSNKGNESNWSNSENMVCFNCPTQTCPLDCYSLNPSDCCLGPSTAASSYAIGVNYDDVIDILKPSNNFVCFQDRDINGDGKGDNEVVSNAFLLVDWT